MSIQIDKLARTSITLSCAACGVTETQVVDVPSDWVPERIVSRVLLITNWGNRWSRTTFHSFLTENPLVCSPTCLEALIEQERRSTYGIGEGVSLT